MAQERYARSSWTKDGVELHPGVEYRDGDDVEEMALEIQIIARMALWACGGNHVALVHHALSLITSKWPDRAYFIETDENGRGVQVYDPRDFVKERCDCPCTHARRQYTGAQLAGLVPDDVGDGSAG